MYTRLALATGATVKALVPISYTDRQAHQGPGPWPRAYGPRILWSLGSGDDIKRTSGCFADGDGEGEGERTRESPNIDLFEISNSPLSCRVRARARACVSE